MIAGQHMPRRPSTGASSQSRNIMSLRDLGRIKQRASEVDVRPINYAIERKKRLKALSKEKTARFPDTLEAMRDRKQNFIKMKKEAEEEARREIDREEARFQREQRNNIIKKAEEAFFNQTDRMKLLLSRQAIAETIHERKKQIEERKVREQAEREEAAKYHVYTMEKVARGIEEEAAHAVFTPEELLAAQVVLRRMPVGHSVVEMILDLVRAVRPDAPEASDAIRQAVAWGPGPRAAQALMLAVRAKAVLDGRLAPSVEDVVDMARPVLSHRMSLTFAARARGDSLTALINSTTQDLTTRSEAAA